LTRANYLDDYLATYEKPIGPLHGLPISAKEHIGMKGLGLNGGFVSWWDHKGAEDALILQLLWKAGCVFYVRTTQPQTLMHLETSNNLYGETVCPFNRKLTSGGSSGGEGALVGLRGSCLGIGTDIGGSIRSPAANNGVYGFRPTSYRLPVGGFTATMFGQEHIVPVVGPLSTSLQGCKIFMKTLIDQKPWLKEPSLIPFPWRDNVSYLTKSDGKKRLKVAVLWDDGVVKPHPPIIRALKEVSEKLQNIPGVEIVDWKPYKHDHAWEIISSLYFADGAKEEKEAIEASEEPWRPLSHFIITEQQCCKELTVSELWSWTVKREAYRAEYAEVWNKTGVDEDADSAIDVILCPVGPGAAPPLNHARYWGYTSQWNLLDYPALVFPVTKVDQEKDQAEPDYKPMNDQDEFNHKLYSPTTYVDAPISLQLVGRRYEDEKVFEALEFVQEAIGLPLRSWSADK
jgi:amidase